MSTGLHSESLVRQSQSVERMATFAHRALKALSENDMGSFRSANDTLRLLRAEVGEVKQMAFGSNDDARLDALTIERTRIAIEIVKVSEKVISDWSNTVRQQMSQGHRFDSVESCHLFLDVMLPEVWNFSKDMLFVAGDVTQELLTAVKARGQESVALVGQVPDGIAESSEFVHITGDETFINWEKLLPKIPSERLTTIRIGDAIDESTVADVLENYKMWLRQAGMNDATLRKFALDWLTQACGNISTLARHAPLRALDGVFAGRAAIIVSPGPSLEKNIDHLRSVQGRALIIAPAQTLTRLVRAGVIPDVVMVTDPLDLTADPYRFLDLADQCPDSILIAKGNCHYQVLNAGFKRVFWSLNGTPDDHWLADLFEMQPLNISGGSVSVSAFRLAVNWGCAPIALVGQDLALSGDRQYAGERANNTTATSSLHELPGFHGGTVLSPTSYFMYHDQFMSFAKILHAQNMGGRIFNCTEGGAYIEGFQHLALEDFIENHLDTRERFAPAELIDQAAPEATAHAARQARVAERVALLLSDVRHAASWYGRIDRWLARGDVTAQLARRIDREQLRFLAWLESKPFLTAAHKDMLKSVRYVVASEKSVLAKIASVHASFRAVSDTAIALEHVVDEQLLRLRQRP
jgi:hypothetical protein